MQTHNTLAAFTVIGAVSLNAFLAVINSQLHSLSIYAVIIGELTFVVVAHLIAIRYYKVDMEKWYCLIMVLLLIATIRSFFTSSIEIKYFRDLLIIPTFIVLGMTFDHRSLDRVIAVVHTLVLLFLFVEAFDLPLYSAIFKVENFYINTRGLEAIEFWNTDSDLYVSATRPDARFFSMIDLHRLSSIFLEPVSLGNYCIIIVSYVCCRYQQLSVPMRYYLIFGAIVALIGCDGRLGMVTSAIIIMLRFGSPHLPSRSGFLYLPIIVTIAYYSVTLARFYEYDDFQGRIAHTILLIERLDVPELFGISSRYLSEAVDSGVVYIMITQSIFGLFIVWVFISFANREDTLAQLRFNHAICAYFSLAMMVSNSFLSIKTAALLWFIQGSLQSGQSVYGKACLARRANPGLAVSAGSREVTLNFTSISGTDPRP